MERSASMRVDGRVGYQPGQVTPSSGGRSEIFQCVGEIWRAHCRRSSRQADLKSNCSCRPTALNLPDFGRVS